MRVLWVSAHPDPRSLNGALRDHGLAVLREQGHDVVESDLYALCWNPVVDHADFAHDPEGRLDVLGESELALRAGTLSEDIRREQDKLLWADTLVVQFPLWWFGMPAILKGWFDRLFVQGFAQGIPHPETGRAMRYGDGGLAGRRALVITTVGANAATTGPRGIHGDLDDVLFPLLHGTLWYTGMSVVPPLVVHGTVKLSSEEYERAAARLTERLATLEETPPLRYRRQNGGHYNEHLLLRPEHAPGQEGIRIHTDARADAEAETDAPQDGDAGPAAGDDRAVCERTGGSSEAER